MLSTNLPTPGHKFKPMFLMVCERKCILLPNGTKKLNFDFLLSFSLVIRASVPKLDLDDAFEQKNDIAKAVEDELEKVKAFTSVCICTRILDVHIKLIDEHFGIL